VVQDAHSISLSVHTVRKSEKQLSWTILAPILVCMFVSQDHQQECSHLSRADWKSVFFSLYL